MTMDAVGEQSPRPPLTLGRVEMVRVQVGYRADPDGPVHQQFLLDLVIPEPDTDETTLDETRVLAALEPVLYAGSEARRHYSAHTHRWHTSWGASPGTLEIGLLVTTGTSEAAASPLWVDGVTQAFHNLLQLVGAPDPAPTPREAAILRARRTTASVYALDPDGLSLSAEEHHPADNAWTLGLRAQDGHVYEVTVGLVDGNARSVRVVHARPSEVFDSVGAE